MKLKKRIHEKNFETWIKSIIDAIWKIKSWICDILWVSVLVWFLWFELIIEKYLNTNLYEHILKNHDIDDEKEKYLRNFLLGKIPQSQIDELLNQLNQFNQIWKLKSTHWNIDLVNIFLNWNLYLEKKQNIYDHISDEIQKYIIINRLFFLIIWILILYLNWLRKYKILELSKNQIDIEKLKKEAENYFTQLSFKYAEINKQKTFLDWILKTASEWIITIDSNWLLINRNNWAKKIFWYSKEEMIWQPIDRLLVDPNFSEKHKQLIKNFIDNWSEKTIWTTREIIWKRANWEICYLIIWLSNYIDESWNIFITWVITDISEKKKIEIELRKKNEDLMNTINTLNKMVEKLEIMDKAKQSFLWQFSHELRTPLNAIIWFSEIIKNSNNLEYDRLKEYIEIIYKWWLDLLQKIDEILDSIRIQNLDPNNELIKYNLLSIFQEIFQEFKIVHWNNVNFNINIDFRYEIILDKRKFILWLKYILEYIIKKWIDNKVININWYYDENFNYCIKIIDPSKRLTWDNIQELFDPYSFPIDYICEYRNWLWLWISIAYLVFKNLKIWMDIVPTDNWNEFIIKFDRITYQI